VAYKLLALFIGLNSGKSEGSRKHRAGSHQVIILISIAFWAIRPVPLLLDSRLLTALNLYELVNMQKNQYHSAESYLCKPYPSLAF
jgi:hypothetical protein